jgi:hypothetical protein
MAGAGDVPKSQWTAGDHPPELGDTPSHCSTNTVAPGANPFATIVNGSGLPDASPGTVNGEELGVVIAA